MSAFPALIGGAYKSQSLIADCEDTINLIVERMESPGAQAAAVLYPTPGCQEFGETAQNGGRCFFAEDGATGRVFSITGQRLYEWHTDGTVTERGTVAINANPATICTNGAGGDQLFITAGGNGYYYNLNTNVLTAIGNLAGLADQGAFINGFFLSFHIATGTVYQSDLYDGATWDPLNFFQRNTQPDDWIAMYVTSWNQIFLAGAKTRDYYYYTGTGSTPFAAAQSGVQPEGIAATFSVVEANGQLVWLMLTNQGGLRVMAATGYRGQRISNHAMETEISGYLRYDDAIGQSYEDDGHPYYLLKFPSANVTWCYDFSSQLWHKRLTLKDDGTYEAWRLTYHCFGFNMHLWLDANSGKAYESSVNYAFDVEGRVIRRERTSPAICVDPDVVLDIGQIELLMQVGVGNANDPGATPMILLQISRDGGITWGRERAASVGRIGEYQTRVRWQANGSGRNVAFRFIMTDPIVNWRIVQAYLQLFDSNGREIPLRRAA